MVGSGVAVVLLAILLIGQVGRGLVSARTRAALVTAQSGIVKVEDQINTIHTPTDQAPVVDPQLQEIAKELSDAGQVGSQYRILLIRADGTGTTYATSGVRATDVPGVLQRELDRSGLAYSYVHGAPDELVVGGVVDTSLGDYRLYQFFPLSSEQSTLSLVRRTTGIVGGLLVLLLPLLVYLVLRQVVQPVRDAARTAERLALGDLEERMKVRGEDEIARLATTFNSMAEALQKQIRQLEDLSRVQRRFVADVTHELRTPITTVRMAADVLHEARTDFPLAAARSAELLQAELGRFEQLLSELLEMSRYDAGDAQVDAEPTDLVALTHRVVDAVRPLAERKGSALVVQESGRVVAEVDHVRIERVVRNLIVNAIEHGEGRPVEIRLAADDRCVAVTVRDSGVGLRPGEEQLVFTRFWRGDPSRTRATGGTGLGLAIAREDARVHGGALEAWGAPGSGAVFRLTLPVTLHSELRGSALPLGPVEVPT
ncbi:MAG: two-component system, OmpR family, sensor histidine kinase MtrB [Frankiales bacterium]|nr:Two-component system histidine kinase [Frankiales bacterium]MDX6266057.1 two-component system, OmpR family, sensor histidine kinase MtrB [Frankiales bacterium]